MEPLDTFLESAIYFFGLFSLICAVLLVAGGISCAIEKVIARRRGNRGITL